MKMLSEKLPMLMHVKEAAAHLPLDYVLSTTAPVMYHFPKSSCERLKIKSQPKDGDPWVSTYDSIMGLLWKVMTKASAPSTKPEPGEKTMLAHAVNNRSVLSPPLSDRYIGNAVSLARCEPVPVEVLLSPDSLAATAASVRSSIKRIDAAHVHDTAAWVAGTEDKNWITMSFLRLYLAGTSWQTMQIQSQDFGFGAPKALRFPSPTFPDYVFVYPHRQLSLDSGEGIEVCVCLERSCQDRLLLDEELQDFAQPRGV